MWHPTSHETPQGRSEMGQNLRIGEEFHAGHGSVSLVSVQKGLDGTVVPAPLGELVHLGYRLGAENPVGQAGVAVALGGPHRGRGRDPVVVAGHVNPRGSGVGGVDPVVRDRVVPGGVRDLSRNPRLVQQGGRGSGQKETGSGEGNGNPNQRGSFATRRPRSCLHCLDMRRDGRTETGDGLV